MQSMGLQLIDLPPQELAAHMCVLNEQYTVSGAWQAVHSKRHMIGSTCQG